MRPFAILALTILLIQPHRTYAASEIDSLRLECSTDDRSYVQGQSIIVLVKVRNMSSGTFRDLSLLTPWVGSLRLTLERNGNPTRWVRGSSDILYAAEGLSLPQGSIIGEVFDLLTYFGSEGPVTLADGTSRSMRCLPPGRYELWVTLSPRTGLVKGLPKAYVRSVGVFFNVTGGPLDLRPDVVLKAASKREAIERHAKARCVSLLWRDLRTKDSEFPAQEAINLFRVNRRSTLLSAAIINRWCVLIPDSERADWIGKTRPLVQGDPDLESVLDYWELKLGTPWEGYE